MRRCIALAPLALLCIFASVACKADDTAGDWAAVRDTDLRIEPGSVLDFSTLFGDRPDTENHPVGIAADGHLAIDGGNGRRIRFLCAPLLFGGPHGGFPEHGKADELAGQLRMHGYNLVRFHYLDDALMEGRHKDFDYDPQQLDRFFYFLAALKKQNIYWMLDAATSENGAYAARDKTRNLRLAIHYDPEARRHWETMVTTLLGRVNPYTKRKIIADPALAIVTVVNESGLEYLTRAGYPPELLTPFRQWLQAHYKTPALLGAAWREPAIGAMDTIQFPAEGDTTLPVTDLLRFFADLESDTLAWSTAFLRKQGYTGLITNYNNGRSVYSRTIGRDLQLVSQHGYFDHPSDFIRPGSIEKGGSSIEGLAPYARDFAASRFAGKPFIVDEYDHPFWNPRRFEAGLVIPAYAALQGWDGIARFANPVELSYGKSTFQRHTLINPFGIGMDPVARAGETLAALLFRRGDVAQAQGHVGIDLTTATVYDDERGRWRPMPDDLSALGLITGLGLYWNGSSVPADWKSAPVLALTPPKLMRKLTASSADDESLLAGRIAKLRETHLLPPANQTDPAAGIYQSDTGEILLEAQEGRLRVVTPATEAVSLDRPAAVALPHLKIVDSSGPALVSLSSLDQHSLTDSGRMLLIFATDAQNSDMRFSADGTTLQDLGKPPLLIRTARITLDIMHNSSKHLHLYATALNGKRSESIPLETIPEGIRFTLDTSSLKYGPTTYFELVESDAAE